MKVMNLEVGNASRPVILDESNYRDSIMEEPITSALSIFRRVIHDGEVYRKQELKKREEKEVENFDTDWSFKIKNNIIAFLGDRGSGKTSCMLSTEKIILEDEKYKKRVLTMDVIDPSFFDEAHNILELFVAQLYTKFAKVSANDHRNKEEVLRLRQSFLSLQNNLKYLDEKKYSEAIDDDYSLQLDTLASGVYLQTTLRKVICETLKYFNRDFLIITIDDLDMNTSRAYEMMEQIRKYLVLPETIILLSAKIDQLKRAAELYLFENYEKMKDEMRSRIPEMAERYVTKFLPQSHRVYMVATDVFLTSELALWAEDGNLIREFQSVAGGVLDLIFQKTRYLFYNIAGSFSYIIPRNLRNLTMLIELLIEMDDFDDSVTITSADTLPAKRNLQNKRRFKNYFFTDFINIFEQSDTDKIKKIISETDMSVFNKVVLDVLNEMYSYHFRYYDGKTSFEDICSDEVIPYNLSVGDILEVLEYLGEILTSEKDRNILFFIRAIYSIRLYECYDLMTDKWNLDKPELDENFKIIPKVEQPKWLDDMPVLSDNIFMGIPDYFKLVGGNFISFNRRPKSLLQSQRDMMLLDGKKIRETIAQLVSIHQKWKKENKDKKQEERAPLPKGFSDKVKLMEFFALCSAFHVDVKSKRDLNEMRKAYRTIPVPYYLKRFTGVQNIVFDIMRPLMTTVHPMYAYVNYGFEFYVMCADMISNEPHSLLAELLLINKRYGNDKKLSTFSDLASRMAIRNMEILTDLYGKLRSRSSSIRVHADTTGIAGMYRELLNYISGSYSVKTYSLSEKDKAYHTITFKPLENLVNVMEKVMESKELKALFESCFISEEKSDLSEKKPQQGTPEYDIITPGFYYTTDRTRRIIFKKYPEYKKEYDNQGPIFVQLRDPHLHSMDGRDVAMYLASITNDDHYFYSVFNEESGKLYADRLEELGIPPF